MSTPFGDLPAASESEEFDPSVQIALQGLVSARWVLLLILVGIGILGELMPSVGTESSRWFGERSNLPAIVATVLLWGGSNWATGRWLDALSQWGNRVAGLHLVGDIVALTVLLGLTGGATNPFTVLFVVPITLATQVSPRWTWGVAICSVIAFGILLDVAPVDAAQHVNHAGMGHRQAAGSANHYSDHLRGMWLSLGLAGGLITFFVHRIALGIAQQRAELSDLREDARLDRELAMIGSLAAGAAHELGSPLATLTVLAGELEHMPADEQRQAITTMRSELGRCKHIIGSMASSELRAGVMNSSDIAPWSIGEIAEELPKTLSFEFEGEADLIPFVPKTLVISVVKELVKNATAASDGNDVRVFGVRDSRGIEVVVSDKGSGMDKEVLAAATDPFYSTKSSAENMGLGLFLIRSQLRSYGGKLSIRSVLGKGTDVQVYIPDVEDE